MCTWIESRYFIFLFNCRIFPFSSDRGQIKRPAILRLMARWHAPVGKVGISRLVHWGFLLCSSSCTLRELPMTTTTTAKTSIRVRARRLESTGSFVTCKDSICIESAQRQNRLLLIFLEKEKEEEEEEEKTKTECERWNYGNFVVLGNNAIITCWKSWTSVSPSIASNPLHSLCHFFTTLKLNVFIICNYFSGYYSKRKRVIKKRE